MLESFMIFFLFGSKVSIFFIGVEWVLDLVFVGFFFKKNEKVRLRGLEFLKDDDKNFGNNYGNYENWWKFFKLLMKL